MKELILFILILGISISCKKNNQDDVPSDPLYQKWKLIETQTSNGAWERVSDDLVIELYPDGRIQYQRPEPACCSPIRFERQTQTLKIAEIYGGGDCIYVDCAPPSAYKIVSLTPNELILEMIFGSDHPVRAGNLKYQSVP